MLYCNICNLLQLGVRIQRIRKFVTCYNVDMYSIYSIPVTEVLRLAIFMQDICFIKCTCIVTFAILSCLKNKTNQNKQIKVQIFLWITVHEHEHVLYVCVFIKIPVWCGAFFKKLMFVFCHFNMVEKNNNTVTCKSPSGCVK